MVVIRCDAKFDYARRLSFVAHCNVIEKEAIYVRERHVRGVCALGMMTSSASNDPQAEARKSNKPYWMVTPREAIELTPRERVER